MSWVTVIWSMCASACLTLAFVHGLVWAHDRSARASLLFALAAVGAAGFALCELLLLQAQTSQEFAIALRWAHVPLWLWMVSLAGFVCVFLRAGRAWLLWSVVGLRTLVLGLNFVTGQSLNFLEITSFQQVPFLGEPVAMATGVANPAMLLGQFSVLAFLILVADAGITAWRRGHRRRALMVSGSVIALLTASAVEGNLVVWAGLRLPFTISLFHLGMLAAMGFELSRDVLQASRLVRELQASEASLRESRQRMNLAADAADLGLWVWEPGADDVWATPRCCAMLGLPQRAHFALADFTDRVHPDDRERITQPLRRALEERQAYAVQYRVRLPSGDERWIEATGRVDEPESGRARRLQGVCSDITERRRAEQETARLRTELAHAGRVSMMGQLASALAHEINQPLGAILRNAEAAELFLQEPAPDLDEIRAIVADIRHDDQRASAVIDRMRALLRRQELQARPLGVGELFGDVSLLVRADAADRHIRLDVAELPPGLPDVRGDRVHLQQVLINLIINAMDALAGTAGPDRWVSLVARQLDARFVEIAVSDSGAGIPADRLVQVFDPFFTTKAGGMGMGLAISRTLVEAHGGHLWADNRPGGGAIFAFSLPISIAPDAT
jgi:two-component system, LuxR family, sensor kinase FixL